ncbi:MAG: hypothetical protein KatS3mg013_2154 [Actinomycetota bacterium]|jgi:membrane protease YdiL (CAAX protease family)|nr:MAG: hypothetical protein KatS3mg013_2154 [Actinomycetota bacterium]
MDLAVALVGGPVVALVVALAWRANTRAMGPLVLLPAALVLVGLAAFAVRPPRVAPSVGPVAALAAGIATGLGLWAAARALVALAGPRFAAATRALYTTARGSAGPGSVGLVVLAALGEEVFWRGLVQPLGAEGLGGAAPGAVVGWLAFVAANATSGRSPILVAAVVGGACWSALAWWSGGVLAGAVSHMLFAGLMLAAPPWGVREEGGR